MTPDALLKEILGRLGSVQGEPIFFSKAELDDWPKRAVSILQDSGLLEPSSPASSTVCPGCERECAMPVNIRIRENSSVSAFIVCDKRSDINRVQVLADYLPRWQTSGSNLANVLAPLLEMSRENVQDTQARHWDIGMLKGSKHKAHVILIARDELMLKVAGHQAPLADLLEFRGNRIAIHRPNLINMVDNPKAGSLDVESAKQRRERLKKRVDDEKRKGNRSILKFIADEEGISVSRLKQLVYEPKS